MRISQNSPSIMGSEYAKDSQFGVNVEGKHQKSLKMRQFKPLGKSLHAAANTTLRDVGKTMNAAAITTMKDSAPIKSLLVESPNCKETEVSDEYQTQSSLDTNKVESTAIKPRYPQRDPSKTGFFLQHEPTIHARVDSLFDPARDENRQTTETMTVDSTNTHQKRKVVPKKVKQQANVDQKIVDMLRKQQDKIKIQAQTIERLEKDKARYRAELLRHEGKIQAKVEDDHVYITIQEKYGSPDRSPIILNNGNLNMEKLKENMQGVKINQESYQSFCDQLGEVNQYIKKL